MPPQPNAGNHSLNLDEAGPVSWQESEDWKAKREEDRRDRAQTHRHKKSWAEFISDRIFVVLLLGLGAVLVFTSQDPMLRTGYISAFSGVVGAITQKLRLKGADE